VFATVVFARPILEFIEQPASDVIPVDAAVPDSAATAAIDPAQPQ